MEELIKRLIELIETASPKMWEIAMRQVWINNIINLLTLLGLVFCIFALFKWGFPKLDVWLSKMERVDREMWNPMFKGICWVVVIVLAIFAMSCVQPLATGLLNPQYAAIYNLLSLVK
jgi:hypothetical protein